MKNDIIKEIEAELEAKKNTIPPRFVPETKPCAYPSIERYLKGCRCPDCCYTAKQYRKKFGKKE